MALESHHATMPISTMRDIYGLHVPVFTRSAVVELHERLPGGDFRRIGFSPTASPAVRYAAASRMADSTSTGQGPVPLDPVVTLGTITYGDQHQTTITPEITGTIDKGFFMADGDWTCYRRNYFACSVSYSLSPYHASMQSAIQYTGNGDSRIYPVNGFAMCISAVVADAEVGAVELVQHTPKRDKGPTNKPEHVRLTSKTIQSPYHPHNHPTPDPLTLPPSSIGGEYLHPPAPQYPHYHIFERIQFKSATQNNGKRRAAQQYYQVVVELYIDTSPMENQPHWVRVAYRKSARMIVRGRSPGHYRPGRHGSHNGAPGPRQCGYGHGASLAHDYPGAAGSSSGATSGMAGGRLPVAGSGGYHGHSTGHDARGASLHDGRVMSGLGAHQHHQQHHHHDAYHTYSIADTLLPPPDDLIKLMDTSTDDYRYYTSNSGTMSFYGTASAGDASSATVSHTRAPATSLKIFATSYVPVRSAASPAGASDSPPPPVFGRGTSVASTAVSSASVTTTAPGTASISSMLSSSPAPTGGATLFDSIRKEYDGGARSSAAAVPSSMAPRTRFWPPAPGLATAHSAAEYVKPCFAYEATMGTSPFYNPIHS